MLLLNSVPRAIALGVLIGLLASAAPATATPVNVYADGTTDFGFDPADVAAAISAGADAPTEVSGLVSDVPWLKITTPLGIPGVKGKDKLDPSRGSSIWTLRLRNDAPEKELQNLALVILGHSPNDPIEKYLTGNVGLEIDTELPWLFVTPEGEEPVYVAYRLGDLQAGGEYQIPIEYLLGQKLKKAKNESGKKVLMFPLYAYAVVSLPGKVPEPSTLALLVLGAASLHLAARRAR